MPRWPYLCRGGPTYAEVALPMPRRPYLCRGGPTYAVVALPMPRLEREKEALPMPRLTATKVPVLPIPALQWMRVESLL